MSSSHSHADASAADAVEPRAATKSRGADFLALTKPRLNFLVLLTTAAAYRIGAQPGSLPITLVHTLVGTALVAGGASALNQVWERESDKLMRRTRLRPLPDARMTAAHARIFGFVLSIAGLVQLAVFVNLLSAGVALLTLASYVWFYTPLKFRTSLSTIVGALPGALPAVIGWSAATNSLSLPGWVLFGIVFMWQMPHFLAIAWMYRDEYARAGYPAAAGDSARWTLNRAAGGALRGRLDPGDDDADVDRPVLTYLPRRRDRARRDFAGLQPGVRRHPNDGLGAAAVSELDHLPADPVGPAGVGPRWEVGAVSGIRDRGSGIST